MILKSTFEVVSDIWQKNLWPDRKSKIEPHSAMLIAGDYELKNYEYIPSFFICFVDNKIVGCNSGHKCCDGSYRSRGLYVFPEYRKKGYGKELLLETIEQGRKEEATFVWSYPRYESWPTYHASGFRLVTDWKHDETGINAFCVIKI